MIERLEQIRLLTSELHDGEQFDFERSNRLYTAAFRKYGVDVDMPETAAAWLGAKVEVLPALIVALDEWAWCRREAKDETGAKALTDLAQSLDGDPWRRRVRGALAAHNKEALMQLAASEDLERQAPSTLHLVARATRENGAPERALEILASGLSEHPDDFWLHFEAGVVNSLSRPQRFNKADLHFTAALALRPQCVAVLNNLGNIRRDQGELDQAITYFRRAIALDPKYATAHNNLGIGFVYQKKPDKAIACFRDAIQIEPDYAHAHFNLGVVLVQQGRLDDAISCWRKTIEFAPRRVDAHYNLGMAFYNQRKLEEAVACWRRVIELQPTEIAFLTHPAWILATAEDPEASLGLLSVSIQGGSGYDTVLNAGYFEFPRLKGFENFEE